MSKTWEIDFEKTRWRHQQLSDMYRLERLNANNFACKYYRYCKESQKEEGIVKQYAGGTAALMPAYDVYYNNQAIRVLVIGKETGYMPNTVYGTSDDFNTNNNNVLNCINWKKKNNHIKGTLYILQSIFNIDTEYVYASYALTDLIRCSFQKSALISNVSNVHDTKVMRHNCIEYLIKEIDILEPTLIIAQGEWTIKNNILLNKLYEHYGLYKEILKNSNEKYGLYEFKKFMCITCHHPAILGNWIKNLAPDSVWPMLEHLKQIGYLPDIDAKTLDTYEKLVFPVVNPIIEKLPSNDWLRQKKRSMEGQLNLFE